MCQTEFPIWQSVPSPWLRGKWGQLICSFRNHRQVQNLISHSTGIVDKVKNISQSIKMTIIVKRWKWDEFKGHHQNYAQKGNSLTVCGSSRGQTLCSKVNSASDFSEFASNHPQSVHKQSGRKLVGTGDLVVTLLWPREFRGGGHESVAMIVTQKWHGGSNEIWSRVGKEGTEERNRAKASKLCQWKKRKQWKEEDQYVLIYL